jgi:predicted ATPase
VSGLEGWEKSRLLAGYHRKDLHNAGVAEEGLDVVVVAVLLLSYVWHDYANHVCIHHCRVVGQGDKVSSGDSRHVDGLGLQHGDSLARRLLRHLQLLTSSVARDSSSRLCRPRLRLLGHIDSLPHRCEALRTSPLAVGDVCRKDQSLRHVGILDRGSALAPSQLAGPTFSSR